MNHGQSFRASGLALVGSYRGNSSLRQVSLVGRSGVATQKPAGAGVEMTGDVGGEYTKF